MIPAQTNAGAAKAVNAQRAGAQRFHRAAAEKDRNRDDKDDKKNLGQFVAVHLKVHRPFLAPPRAVYSAAACS